MVLYLIMSRLHVLRYLSSIKRTNKSRDIEIWQHHEYHDQKPFAAMPRIENSTFAGEILK